MSLRKALRTMLVGSSEMLLAVAVVLVLGLVFMGTLIVSFPEGSGLVHVYGSAVDGRSGEARLDMTEQPEFVARLKEIGCDAPLIIEREISGEQQKKDIADTVGYLEKLVG